MSSINRMYYGTKKIYPFLEGDNDNTNCPELTTLDVTENGTYEGAFDVVNVNVKCTGGGSIEGGENSFAVLGWSNEDGINLIENTKDVAIRKMEEFDTNRESLENFFREDEYANNVDRLVFAPYFDTSNITHFGNTFYGCTFLIGLPMYNTSRVTFFGDVFGNCDRLEFVPNWDTSNGEIFAGAFRNTKIKNAPNWDFSKATNISNLFCFCSRLRSIPLYNFSNVTEINEFFGWYGENNGLDDLTTLGGFEGLKINWNDENGLKSCKNINYESIMNVINHLYDFRGNGDNNTTRMLKIHSNTMALLSNEDKEIAINKGWILEE